jgi:23S rRNA (guanosine2251-2'-O)-methyltransferase
MNATRAAKTETLYGLHPVAEALGAKRRTIQTVLVARKKTPDRLNALLAQAVQIPVREADADQLRILAGTDDHQGVVAIVSAYPTVDLADIVHGGQDLEQTPFLLLIDTVVDPHNLGALVRSALCAGVDGVVIPKDRSVPPTPSVSKASAGALEHIRLCRVTNMANTIKTLKKQGLWVVGLDRAAEQSVFAADLTGPLALVVGGEEKGIRPLVGQQCDFSVAIPQFGPVNSLNASVAGAVVMYEALRQRLGIISNAGFARKA